MLHCRGLIRLSPAQWNLYPQMINAQTISLLGHSGQSHFAGHILHQNNNKKISLSSHLVKICLIKKFGHQFQAKRYQKNQYKRESKGSHCRLDHNQNYQTCQLNQSEFVHLHSANLWEWNKAIYTKNNEKWIICVYLCLKWIQNHCNKNQNKGQGNIMFAFVKKKKFLL